MHAAHEQNLLIDGLLLIIIVAYLGIAFQFWTRRRTARGGATTALAQLVVIFVFCAFCGYLPRLVSVPDALLIAAHAVLACAAWAYFFSGQVDRLSLAVDHADRDTPENAARRRHEWNASIDAETEACARLADQSGSKLVAQLLRDRLRHRSARDGTAGAAQAGSEPPLAQPAP